MDAPVAKGWQGVGGYQRCNTVMNLESPATNCLTLKPGQK